MAKMRQDELRYSLRESMFISDTSGQPRLATKYDFTYNLRGIVSLELRRRQNGMLLLLQAEKELIHSLWLLNRHH